MDPYLEHSVLWPGVHQGLITYMRAELNTVLPPHYVADIGERIYVVQAGRSIYPDIAIFDHPPAQPPPEQRAVGIAVAASDPPWIVTVKPEEIDESSGVILCCIKSILS
ncbi:DUF4058 family protein [Candidatus Poribacteria bacterium]|nr:DUF4058 family protein [Candidatus Poribacteria bacterium]